MRHLMANRWTAVLLTLVASANACGEVPIALPATNPNAVRVACIGDSITEGYTIDHPEANAYPAVLGRLLGPDYDVRNFGAGGTTCLVHGDDPYTHDPRQMYEKATAFAPQVVVVMLGTNDSKPQNQTHKDEFPGDLAALVDHFATLPGKPKVYICLPAPAFSDA